MQENSRVHWVRLLVGLQGIDIMTRDRYFLFAADTICLQAANFKKRIVSAVEFGIVKKKIEMK